MLHTKGAATAVQAQEPHDEDKERTTQMLELIVLHGDTCSNVARRTKGRLAFGRYVGVIRRSEVRTGSSYYYEDAEVASTTVYGDSENQYTSSGVMHSTALAASFLPTRPRLDIREGED